MPASSANPVHRIPRAADQAIARMLGEDSGASPHQLGTVHGPAASHTLAALAHHTQRPLFVVVPGPQAFEDVVMDLAVIAPALPLIEIPGEEFKELDRADALAAWLPPLRACAALSPSSQGVILAPLASLFAALPDPKHLAASLLTLSKGQSLSPGSLAQTLSAHGYTRKAEVEQPGDFARRGGILDLWAHAETMPLRIDFFGDEIDEIRRFDAANQRSLSTHPSVCFPLLPVADEHLRERWSGLLNYVPHTALAVCIERHESLLRLEGLRPFLRGREMKPRGEAVEQWFAAIPRIELGSAPVMQRPGAINLDARRFLLSAQGGATAAADAIAELRTTCKTITIFGGSHAEAERIREALTAHGVAMRGIDICDAEASGSVLYPATGEACISGADLLGKHRVRHGVFPDETSIALTPHYALDTFIKLDLNDFVVHTEHGIARYRGTEELRTPDGSRGEYLKLEFAEGTEIHVPVTHADQVQKYIGSRGAAPKLSRYRGTAWNERKAEVQQAVLKLAAHMLELQALRSQETGFACPPADHTLHDFVEAFPFRDTPDQERAWQEVQRDMESARPMDRLLCGDVGFGKTEIAMRAAFKAVMAGKQVAILVPTTVLAQQHALSFASRMAGYPIMVEALSRFRSAREQNDIIRRLREGRIDIVIGTHRLLSGDVAFHDLGLVIVDEEQRFGVEHKERIKRLRHTVDVLTLTATPIPRTLHMALLGIRDITSLATPPEHRHPVETSIHAWNDEFIREAIQRELARDGQVFFVHNRVSDIDEVAHRLSQLVPQARITCGHGQMEEGQLEQVMLRFIEGEADILVCTTIIESGIDVQRANTMFIDDATRYGLADLHQLRGRVGRYRHRAYCMLLVSDESRVKEAAEKRLRAILQHTHLGAGFHISMRDLEIRGAGNIIGHEQSGYIATVGYDLYCRMLETAVRKLRGTEAVSEVQTHLDLDLDLVLPDRYVSHVALRVETYRLIARCATPEQADAVKAELKDRFGKPPVQVERLLMVAVLRHRLAQLGISSLTVGVGLKDAPGFFRMRAVSAKVAYGRIRPVLEGVRLVDESTLALPLHKGLQTAEEQLVYLYALFGKVSAQSSHG